MDALRLLQEDHRAVKKLFARFEKSGPRAHKTKADLAEKISRELSIHAAVEELIFYPAVRELVPDETDTVLESLEEHHVAKVVLAELEDMEPEDERFTAKMTVLIESVSHHMDEEEQEMFPAVRDSIDADTLREMGEAMEKAKKVAPTRPHPGAPDTPPKGVLADISAGLLDRLRDAARSAKRAVGSAAG